LIASNNQVNLAAQSNIGCSITQAPAETAADGGPLFLPELLTSVAQKVVAAPAFQAAENDDLKLARDDLRIERERSASLSVEVVMLRDELDSAMASFRAVQEAEVELNACIDAERAAREHL
jgi:hypothetical protein